jgi:hypothetical protein
MKIVARDGLMPAASQSTIISHTLAEMVSEASKCVVSACQSAAK